MSKRILVVEDQPDNRQIIRDMLARTDYEITMRSMGKKRRRARLAVMITCLSLTARANCWRRFGNTCNNGRHISCNRYQIAARPRAT